MTACFKHPRWAITVFVPLLLELAVPLLLLAPTALASGRVQWPTGHSSSTTDDPIATLRWNAEAAWITGSIPRAERALSRIEDSLRQQPRTAMLFAYRAVARRALGQFQQSQDDLRRAVTMDPAVLEDPDVALTHAYLLAREQRFAEAVSTARRAFPRIAGSVEVCTELVLEIARWSMARGPEGLADALTVLREITALGPPTPMVRATLALVLARQGAIDQAREIARGGPLPHPDAPTSTPRGAVIMGENDAAIGVALVLAGRARDAIGPLTRAIATVPPPWRTWTSTYLTTARRMLPPNATGPTVREPLPSAERSLHGCETDRSTRLSRCPP